VAYWRSPPASWSLPSPRHSRGAGSAAIFNVRFVVSLEAAHDGIEAKLLAVLLQPFPKRAFAIIRKIYGSPATVVGCSYRPRRSGLSRPRHIAPDFFL